MGNYKQALDYYNKALKINTKLNDRVILAKDHFNMSFPLYSMNKKKQALEHLYTAKTILFDLQNEYEYSYPLSKDVENRLSELEQSEK
jgi:tetratricopeptide (TPR) repeat protein